ncbi:MAG: hypothetical protein ACRD21_02115 [Vicinamibacteria bacterium]
MLLVASFASYLVSDWIAGLGILVLWCIWRFLFEEGQPPVLPTALSFQWLQVTCGLYYYGITGREVEAMYASDYRPMVLIGLGCVGALMLGLLAGMKLGSSALGPTHSETNYAFTWKVLLVGYIASIFLTALLHEVAWSVPLFTQAILSVSFLRLGMLYLIFRRLSKPVMRWSWFLGILALELGLGFTGYFASFREPLVLASLAFVECFDRRLPSHWLRLAGIASLAMLLGVVWMGIRTGYRQEFEQGTFAQSRTERLETVGSMSSDWFLGDAGGMMEDFDRLVERVWTIYYPAIAVSRVPDVLPHENGAIMLSALKHVVTPRFLFPEKGTLPSDSELVRKYTGIFVAGAEENTSIAFGYAAESYVDFGVPLMFLPSLLYGIFMGFAFRFLSHVIYHREIAVGLSCVIFWLSLYLFERSWIKTFGLTLTLLIYLGALVWFLDRKMRRRSRPTLRPPRSMVRRTV